MILLAGAVVTVIFASAYSIGRDRAYRKGYWHGLKAISYEAAYMQKIGDDADVITFRVDKKTKDSFRKACKGSDMSAVLRRLVETYLQKAASK